MIAYTRIGLENDHEFIKNWSAVYSYILLLILYTLSAMQIPQAMIP